MTKEMVNNTTTCHC